MHTYIYAFICLTQVRMAKSNKTVDSRCWRGFEEKGNLQSLFMGLKTAPAILEIIVKNPQKAKNKVRFFKKWIK